MEERIHQLSKELEELNRKLALVQDGVFQELIKHFKENAERADSAWHSLTNVDQEHFLELKSRKIAYLSVLEYIADLEDAKKDIEDEILSTD